ncbi:Auxin Efflux Carrier [Lutibaculum baratangense AMV1]|uniref:Auxin Efflux Carrier n=2 Tax=Lutibaculum TaxID=1358438 RepID=V4TAA9_9HYPH|nr:Auxin Efflux Carrier [Lutibaculum baratangense AMV1]
MADLLSLTLPIFLLIGLGLFAVKSGILTDQHIAGLAAFVLYFALPALILHAILAQELSETFSLGYILVYGAASVLTFIAVLAVMRLLFRRALSHAAIAALGGSASNSAYVGFPVASQAVGPAALTALPLAMLIENLVVIPTALALAEAGAQNGSSRRQVLRQTLLRFARTPLIAAIILGVALSVFQVELPGTLASALAMLAQASVPCALVVVGGTLAAIERVELAGDVAWIVVAKLVLHPVLVAAGFLLVDDVPDDLKIAGIIIASAPSLGVYPILGRRFGLDRMCAAALMFATVAGFFTITTVLALTVR